MMAVSAPSTDLGGARLWVARLAWMAIVGVSAVVATTAFTEFLRQSGHDLLVAQGPLSLQPGVAAELQRFFDAPFLHGAQVAVHILGVAVFAVTGVIIFVRGSRNAIRILTSVTLVTLGVALFAPTSVLAGARPGWEPLIETLGILAPHPDMWRSLAGVGLIAFALLFPDGRFVPRWSVGPFLAFSLHLALWAVFPDTALDPGRWPDALGDGWTIAPALCAVAAQIYRYATVGQAQRSQTRLVVVAFTTAVLTFGLLWILEPNLDPGVFELVVASGRLQALYDLNILLVLTVALLLWPVAITVSVVRYRLWDVELIVNRALVYGALTGLLAIAFFVGIVGIGSLLADAVAGGRGVAGVVTGIAVVLALQPVRRRVQASVDRRFYREKYDAERVAEQFATSVGDLVDLELVEAELLGAVDRSLHPEMSALLVAGRDFPAGQVLSANPGSVDPSATLANGGLRSLDGIVAPGGAELLIPLTAHNDLVGVLAIGQSRSGRGYGTLDIRLLTRLAAAAAPALRIAALVEEQERLSRERLRLESEMEVARKIQHDLLPRRLEPPAGWFLEAHYEPASQVGGDFYDVIETPDGRLGLLIADVSGKGVPAAMVMATCRSVFRAVAAESGDNPAALLAEMNRRLAPDLSTGIFVTCFYAAIDPASGTALFANAGHTLPVLREAGGRVVELEATGTPLGWLPEVTYSLHEAQLELGALVMLHSDGVVEARDSEGRMYGTERLMTLVAGHDASGGLTELVAADVAAHCGQGGAVDDDLTLLVARRGVDSGAGGPLPIATSTLPSEPGEERAAADMVVAAAERLGLDPDRIRDLHSAVAEATLNAIEHGNEGRPELPVFVAVYSDGNAVRVTITDRGEGPGDAPPEPDLDEKLAGRQSPRGWGLFLIEQLVDEVRHSSGPGFHTVELVVHLGAGDAA